MLMQTPPLTLDPAMQAELGTVAHREARAGAASRPALEVVCVTLYNEPLAALTGTVASVIRSARDALLPHEMPCVCLMADGARDQHPEVTRFLCDWGFDVALGPDDADTVLHHGQMPASAWGVHELGAQPVRIVLSVKRRNRGKLHSHALFFGVLCPLLSPRHCWQIDAGTRVEPRAMREMLCRFEDAPEVGAVGSRVEIAAPEAQGGYVQRWQHMDFAVQLATFWPAEVAAGHLSVVPGQFCAFRWEAMAGRAGSAPVRRYLRGLRPASRMERIMFMAEDRVIGNELVLSGSAPWRLAYGHRAGAHTDACATTTELLRQRRRWHNCSFACRLWLLAQWPAQMTRPDRGPVQKAGFSLSMAWQAVLAAMQGLMPAIALAGWLSIGTTLWLAWGAGHAGLAAMAASLMGLAGLLAPGSMASRSRLGARVRDGAAAVGLGVYLFLLGRIAGLPLVLALWAPPLLAAVLPALVLPGRRWAQLRHVPEHVLFNGLFQCVLWGYALRHLGDTSWGTKGLVDSTGAAGGSRYEPAVVTLSLAANAAVLAACIGATSVWAAPSNPGVEWASGLTAVTLVAALLGHARLGLTTLAAAWRRAWRKPRSAPAWTAVER